MFCHAILLNLFYRLSVAEKEKLFVQFSNAQNNPVPQHPFPTASHRVDQTSIFRSSDLHRKTSVAHGLNQYNICLRTHRTLLWVVRGFEKQEEWTVLFLCVGTNSEKIWNVSRWCFHWHASVCQCPLWYSSKFLLETEFLFFFVFFKFLYTVTVCLNLVYLIDWLVSQVSKLWYIAKCMWALMPIVKYGRCPEIEHLQ